MSSNHLSLYVRRTWWLVNTTNLSTQHTCQHNILNVLIDSELQTLRIRVRGFVNKHLIRNLLWVGGLRVHSVNKIKLY